MNPTNEFNPNWASVPGDTIGDVMSLKQLSIPDFAKKMDSTPEYIKDLLHGFVSINNDIAIKLSSVLGASKDFWIKREQDYREAVERLKIQEEKKWVLELPIADMLKFGWITKTTQVASECLRYFGVPDVWTWRRRYSDVTALTAFRKSEKIQSVPGSVAAWLRQGDIQASKINCESWNKELFELTLPEIKKLTLRKSPKLFLPDLIRLCARCGVAVVIAQTPKGCPASGATKFLTDNKAVILLSFRYKTDDHFWFTFFHEAGHLLLHGNKQIFLEEDGHNLEKSEEREANEFSENILISGNLKTYLKTAHITETTIRKIAKEAGISLGIVAGQLEHFDRVKYGALNSYKRKFDWNEISQSITQKNE